MAEQKQPSFIADVLNLSDEECKKCEDHCKSLCLQAVPTTFGYPLAFARTLMQLGHEPYPIEPGKTFFGAKANYLPNAFKYVGNIYRSHGFVTLYMGIGAHILQKVTDGVGTFAITMYLDKCFPELGGAQEIVVGEGKENEENRDDAYNAFRLKIREAMRKSVAQLAGLLISRPFAVLMVRQIAQHVGNETKYAAINPLQPLMRIGMEEGPAGFYSGIIPASISVLISVWGTAAIGYAVGRAFNHFEKERNVRDHETKEISDALKKIIEGLSIPMIVNNIRYPYDVVSTVMAVVGSGLLVSFMPYSPVFSHWTDAYDSLKQCEQLFRGGKLFLRNQKLIRIGPDHETYAAGQKQLI